LFYIKFILSYIVNNNVSIFSEYNAEIGITFYSKGISRFKSILFHTSINFSL